MDEILKIIEEEEADADRDNSKGNAINDVLQTMDETTARVDIEMRDAKIAGDIYYERVGAWLKSENLRGVPVTPMSLFRKLRDKGYSMCVLAKTQKGRIYLLRLMINRFGNCERELHSRIVVIVFFCGTESGLDVPGLVVNFFFGDRDVTGEEQSAFDTLI